MKALEDAQMKCFNLLYSKIDAARFTQVKAVLRQEFDVYLPETPPFQQSRDSPTPSDLNVNLQQLMAMQGDY